MTTYPLSFPFTPTTERLTLDRRQAAMESAYTLKTQVVHTASQWKLDWTWSRMGMVDASTASAWLNGLRGQVGTFTYTPVQEGINAFTGRTLATAGFAYSNVVTLGGWPANATSGLRLGQYFQIGTQLLQLTAFSANASAGGQVTAEFEPALRDNVASGTAVVFANPKGLFRLSSSEGVGATLDPDRLPEFGNMSAREVI